MRNRVPAGTGAGRSLAWGVTLLLLVPGVSTDSSFSLRIAGQISVAGIGGYLYGRHSRPNDINGAQPGSRRAGGTTPLRLCRTEVANLKKQVAQSVNGSESHGKFLQCEAQTRRLESELTTCKASATATKAAAKAAPPPTPCHQTDKLSLAAHPATLLRQSIQQWRDSLDPKLFERFLGAMDAGGRYNVTSHMFRQSRSVVGQTSRLHAVLRKLQRGECITVLALGGSVSHGYNIGGESRAWGHFFETYLNSRFPCKEGKHSFVLRAVGGVSSKPAFTNFENNVWGVNADIIIIEFAVNDGFIGHRQPGDPENVSGEADRQEWYTEALVRRLLRYRANTPGGSRPAAIMYLEAGLRGSPWLDPTFGRELNSARQSIAAWSHWPILQYYGIPTVSWTDVLGPLLVRQRRCRPVPESQYTVHEKTHGCGVSADWWENFANEITWMSIHTDKCCHPKRYTHVVLAYFLAYALEHEMSVLGTEDGLREGWRFEHDQSMLGDGTVQGTVLPAPLKMDDTTDKCIIGVRSLLIRSFFDAADPVPEGVISATPHWNVTIDSKDKLGLISTVPFGHVAIDVSLGAEGYQNLEAVRSSVSQDPRLLLAGLKVEVGFLESYRDISAVRFLSQCSDLLLPNSCLQPSPCRGPTHALIGLSSFFGRWCAGFRPRLSWLGIRVTTVRIRTPARAVPLVLLGLSSASALSRAS